MNPMFKEELFRVLDEIPYPVYLIDMNDVEDFIDEDFHDSDHLSDKGAVKATEILDCFLESI